MPMQAPTNPTTGASIVIDMSNDDYHAHPSISKSGLDLIRRAPSLYLWRQQHKQPFKACYRTGTLAHTLLLEPDRFEREVMVMPKFDRRTTVGKLAHEAFIAEHGQRDYATEEEYELLKGMREAVWNHPAANRLLSKDGVAEQSIFWTDPVTGLQCRCRPDKLRIDDIVIDFKTARDASPAGFARSVTNYRYHVQDPFYCDGIKAYTGTMPKFVFIAVEPEPPHLVGVYVLTEEAKATGRKLYQQDLATLKTCMQTGNWPGYGDKILPLDLPKWAMEPLDD